MTRSEIIVFLHRGRDQARGFSLHMLRATAATNALDHKADIAEVQEWFVYHYLRGGIPAEA